MRRKELNDLNNLRLMHGEHELQMHSYLSIEDNFQMYEIVLKETGEVLATGQEGCLLSQILSDAGVECLWAEPR